MFAQYLTSAIYKMFLQLWNILMQSLNHNNQVAITQALWAPDTEPQRIELVYYVTIRKLYRATCLNHYRYQD